MKRTEFGKVKLDTAQEWRMKLCLLFLIVAYAAVQEASAQCQPCSKKAKKRYTDLIYTQSNEHIVNPSRGFVYFHKSQSSSFSPVSKSTLEAYRESDGISVAWMLYNLDLYSDVAIPQSFIDLMEADMDILREAKFSAIFRIMYTDVQTSGAPYGDPTKAIILQHIEQLRGFFETNHDIIEVVQAGLIGTWGEWYYTTHFGDPDDADWSNPDNVRGMTPQNWADRRDVLYSMLDNIPDDIQVQVRVPQYKYHITQDQTPVTEDEMRQRTNKARIGHFNDCFLASPTDYGTYIDKEREYPFMMEDNRFCMMSGETCNPSADNGDRHHCPTAMKELPELRFNHLNIAYSADVLDLWKQQGCFNDVHRNLGYRFSLVSATLPDVAYIDEKLCLAITIQNTGFGALFKERAVALVLRNMNSGVLYSADLSDVDVRLWQPNERLTIDTAINLPSGMPTGQYELLLNIRDLQQGADFSDYNILLANRLVPEWESGFNNLLHTVQVSAVRSRRMPQPNCPTATVIQAPAQSTYERLYCGLGGCDGGACTTLPISNPSFEDSSDPAWSQFGDGFVYTTATASHGAQSIQVSNGGAYQMWDLPAGTRHLEITADSYNEGIVDAESNDYSIYCDIQLSDGSWVYGEAERFSVTNPAWHTRTLTISLGQSATEAWCYGMFRNYGTGTAYFDNFRVCTSD